MKCPFCNSYKNVKNGYASSGKKRYKCKRCKKTYLEVSTKNYPSTSIPFEFIAFILHRHKNKSLGKTKLIVNHWLNFFKFKQVPICSKDQVSRSCIYKWKKKYGNTYDKLVTKKMSTMYIKDNIDKAGIHNHVIKKENPYDMQELKCITIEEKRKHMEILKLVVDLFGKDFILETIRKYPKIFDDYLKKFATKKYETITWQNK